jgi:U3 small nucleolar RNA-associated protein 18
MDVAETGRLRKLRQSEDEHVLQGGVYRQRLRARFEKIHGGAPAWAAPAAGGDDDDAEDGLTLLTRQSKPLLRDNEQRLAPSVLDVTRSKDANQAGVSQVLPPTSLFAPLTGSRCCGQCGWTAFFFCSCFTHLSCGGLWQVDGKQNNLLQSVHIPHFPIMSAHFSPTGDEIVLAGRRKFFYTYDLQASRIMRIPELQGISRDLAGGLGKARWSNYGAVGSTEKSLEQVFMSPSTAPHLNMLVFTGRNGQLLFVSNKVKLWLRLFCRGLFACSRDMCVDKTTRDDREDERDSTRYCVYARRQLDALFGRSVCF